MASLFDTPQDVLKQQQDENDAYIAANAPNYGNDFLSRVYSERAKRKMSQGMGAGNFIKTIAQRTAPDIFGEDPVVRQKKITDIRQQVGQQYQFGTPEYFNAASDMLAQQGFNKEALQAKEFGLNIAGKEADISGKQAEARQTSAVATSEEAKAKLADKFAETALETNQQALSKLISDTKAVDIVNEFLPQIQQGQVDLNASQINNIKSQIQDRADQLQIQLRNVKATEERNKINKELGLLNIGIATMNAQLDSEYKQELINTSKSARETNKTSTESAINNNQLLLNNARKNGVDVGGLTSTTYSEPKDLVDELNKRIKEGKGEWQAELNEKTGQLIRYNSDTGETEIKQLDGYKIAPDTDSLSTFGKIAKDMGYTPGTPSYNTQVGELVRQENIAKSGGNEFIKKLADDDAKVYTELDTALSNTEKAYASTVEGLNLLQSPDGVITGRFSTLKKEVLKIRDAIGKEEFTPEFIADKLSLSKEEAALLVNTENFINNRIRATLKRLGDKELGSGTGLSNADREFMQAAEAGNISLNEQTIQKVLDVSRRAALFELRQYNDKVDVLNERYELTGNSKIKKRFFDGQIGLNAKGQEIVYNSARGEWLIRGVDFDL